MLIAGSCVGWFVLSGICKKWDPDANERTIVVYLQDIDWKQQEEWIVNQSKQRARADNTIWARGMTTEPVRGGSRLEHGGGSSRGRDRDNRDHEVDLRSRRSLAAR